MPAVRTLRTRPHRPAARPGIFTLACLPICLALLSLELLAAATPAGAIDTSDTRMLAEPAVSGDRVAFVYADDLWVAGLDGSNVHRLTARAGVVGAPRFSPDGGLVAFSAQYDGNLDVYVTPTAGGEPRRLTWHPGADVVQGFTPDGTAVVFLSPRSVHTRTHRHLYTVPVAGGFPERIPLPNVHQASISPDGMKIAYVPDRAAFTNWKRYRGGTASQIWIYDTADHSVEKVPQPPGRCNDADPSWIGGRIWFRSDRAGEFNLFSYDPGDPRDQSAGAVEQHTHHDDFPVLAVSTGAGEVIYEQAGYLHLYDPERDAARRLVLGVAGDLLDRRPRFVSAADFVQHAALSPTGVRAVFETRGEIVTVPAEEGDARNLTRTSSAAERSPVWSPDGRWIAYFSDASGEYQLVIAPHDGREATGATRSIALHGSGFYEDPKWSPDGQWISYTDNSRSLYVLDVASGTSRKISQETMYGPINTLHHAWSPDSRWLAYTRNTKTYFQELEIYSVAEDHSYPVTEGLSDVGEPVFDAGGDYLWFSASTDVGPIRQWFALSSVDADTTNALYAAVLRKDESSPLAPRNQEEMPDGKSESAEKPKAGAGAEGGSAAPVEVAIDFDGLAQRIVALPLEPALYSQLQPGPAGTLYYVKNRAGAALVGPEGTPALARFQMDQRKEETLADGVDRFLLSADRKKVLYHASKAWAIADAGGKIDPAATAEHALPLDAVRLHVDPPAEWAQMLREAWRIERDYFYDPGMHGADWPAVWDEYAAFLPDLAARSDLNRVLGWLGSELTVGHLFVGGGDFRGEPYEVPGGLLGADYSIDHGRYRFAKVYGGLNWNPDLRAPLTEPGVDVHEGEYLLAVDGRELTADDNLYSRFENTAGKVVEITVGEKPDAHPGDEGTRTVDVVPVENEAALRNRAWVEGNLRRVDEATDGRVAYVYVPDTGALGHTYFKRYFYPQADRDAIIVDERSNGGGLVADYYIDILRRPLISHWAMRYGGNLKTPMASIQGPKVMIIDENAGSGGDLLPWMFRKLGLGTIVGERTWGGLVGILGFPPLLDGGRITAPNLAIWSEDGWVVENQGVPPDVEVEQLPAEVMAGHDPQLEKAIEVALEQLAAHPPQREERPAYPRRVPAAPPAPPADRGGAPDGT